MNGLLSALCFIVFLTLANILKSQTDNNFGSLKDKRDGNVYKTVVIGNQTWMAENLAYKPEEGNYRYYNDIEENIDQYGLLYDWETALNVCPDGWRLPSDEDWNIITDYLGGEIKALGKMKSYGTKEDNTGLWVAPNDIGNNKSGFSAIPAGIHVSNNAFGGMGYGSYWWSSTESEENNAWVRHMGRIYTSLVRVTTSKDLGFSVRCILE